MIMGMNALAPLNVPRRLWLRIEDFLLLSDSGVLDEFSKSELIDGEVITMNAQHRPHARAKTKLAYRLIAVLEAQRSPLEAVVEGSVAMPPHDMPEPDIVVTSEPGGAGTIPLASVALLVEVADTTGNFDLGRKAALYAWHQVPEYWVVDIDRAEIVRHWHPGVQGYDQRDATPLGQPISAATIPGLAVATDGLV